MQEWINRYWDDLMQKLEDAHREAGEKSNACVIPLPGDHEYANFDILTWFVLDEYATLYAETQSLNDNEKPHNLPVPMGPDNEHEFDFTKQDLY